MSIQSLVQSIHPENRTDWYNKTVIAVRLQRYLAEQKPGYNEGVSKGVLDIPLLAEAYNAIKTDIEAVEQALATYYEYLPALTEYQIGEIKQQFHKTRWARDLIAAKMSLDELHLLQAEYEKLGFRVPYYHGTGRSCRYAGWSMRGPLANGDTPGSVVVPTKVDEFVESFRDIHKVVTDKRWPK